MCFCSRMQKSSTVHSEKVLRLKVQKSLLCLQGVLPAELRRILPHCLQHTKHFTLNHCRPKPSLLTAAIPSYFIFQSFLSEEIIGGHEAKPHSRPYMAFVQFLQEKSRKRCCGILVRKDFVLTAAHCQGR